MVVLLVQIEDGQSRTQGSMRLTFFHGEYNERQAALLQREYGAAHLLFGPNAGMSHTLNVSRLL
jgi:hypothetical protein